MRRIAISVALVAMAACAKEPDAVQPAQVEIGSYMAMSCRTLSEKEAEGEVAVSSLSAKQKSAASNDALGVFLLGLPLASMSGNDSEAQLSIAKGQLNAIKIAKSKKGCR